MKTTIKENEILTYTLKQVYNFFPDSAKYDALDILPYLNEAFRRLEYCFSSINNKYFCSSEGPIFNHLNGDQYSMYLYFLSNTLFRREYERSLCEKLFLLNKMMFGIDVFYEIDLPEIFLFVHPIGTVLGRAKYSNYLVVYQRCSVGSNHDIYPLLEEYVTLHPGSSVLGNCRVGQNTRIGANAMLIDKNIAENSIYIGNPKDFYTYENLSLNEIWKQKDN